MDLPPLHVATVSGLHTVKGGKKVEFEGHEVTAIARRGSAWWALVEGRELWSRGMAHGWGRRAMIPADRALCLAPTAQGVLIGTSEAHLLRHHRDELARVTAFDAMPGRNAWYTPWGGPPDTRSIALGADGTIYVNVHVGGIARSDDKGEHWRPTIAVDSDVHQVVTHPGRKGVVLAATGVGLGVSHDHGTNWTFVTAGFHALYQRAVALAGDVVLVSASRNERGERAALYRRGLRDEGPFERCAEGLPQWFADNVNTHCIATEGSVAAIGTADGLVFASNDAGKTWEKLAEGLPKVRALVFEQVARGAH
jgi:hypothetical protein